MCTTGDGSRFCLKKGTEHNSNTIKFHLSYEGVLVQSCWSSKVHHFNKPCKSYTSAKIDKVFHLSDDKHLRTLNEVMTCPLEYDSSKKPRSDSI